MAKTKKTLDVFVAHAPADAEFAGKIAAACRTNGLQAATDGELQIGAKASDALWEALAESLGVLFIVSSAEFTARMSIELGAARGWNKAIFGIAADANAAPAAPLSGIGLYPPNQIDKIIRAIKQIGQEISDEDRARLATLYADIGVPVDQLALDPEHLDELIKAYRGSTGRVLSGERLLSELLRMRKQGKLRSKPRKVTT